MFPLQLRTLLILRPWVRRCSVADGTHMHCSAVLHLTIEVCMSRISALAVIVPLAAWPSIEKRSRLPPQASLQ